MTLRTARNQHLLLSLACIAVLGSCTPRNEGLPGEVTTALAAAFTRGDAEACAALYTEDAAIMSDRAAPVRGKEAITSFFKEQVARDILFATDSDVSLVRDDLAMDQGTYRVRDTNRGVDVELGQYLNVWRRIDGHWRVYRSMYNVTSAPRGGGSVTADDRPPP